MAREGLHFTVNRTKLFLMLFDSCALRVRFATCSKTSTSGAAFRALPACAVHAVHEADACSGLRTAPRRPSTAPSRRPTSPRLGVALPLTRTDPTWTWVWPTRGGPALRVGRTKTLVRPAAPTRRMSQQPWARRRRQRLSSRSSRACR